MNVTAYMSMSQALQCQIEVEQIKKIKIMQIYIPIIPDSTYFLAKPFISIKPFCCYYIIWWNNFMVHNLVKGFRSNYAIQIRIQVQHLAYYSLRIDQTFQND